MDLNMLHHSTAHQRTRMALQVQLNVAIERKDLAKSARTSTNCYLTSIRAAQADQGTRDSRLQWLPWPQQLMQ